MGLFRIVQRYSHNQGTNHGDQKAKPPRSAQCSWTNVLVTRGLLAQTQRTSFIPCAFSSERSWLNLGSVEVAAWTVSVDKKERVPSTGRERERERERQRPKEKSAIIKEFEARDPKKP